LKPIEEFRAIAHPIGNEVDIRWEYPDDMSSAYKPFVFKKRGEAVSESAIRTYLDNPSSSSLPKGVYVFYNLSSSVKEITDFDIYEKTTYYYSIVLQDVNDKGNISEVITVSVETPEFKVELNVVDTKSLVMKGIEKLMQALKKNTSVQLEVFNDFPQVDAPSHYIAVTRASGELAYRFWANGNYEVGNKIVKGELEADLIQVTWMHLNSASTRDKTTLFFKGTKRAIYRYCRYNGGEGIKDVAITIMGDGRDETYKDGNYVYGSMLLNFLVENQMLSDETELMNSVRAEFNFKMDE